MIGWADVREELRVSGRRAIALHKSAIGHPRDAGALSSIGFPRGQISDWRFPPESDCTGLHVCEFPRVWDAHVDRVHPRCDLLGHVKSDLLPFVVDALKTIARTARELVARPLVDERRGVPVPLEDCTMAIVLVATDPRNHVCRTVDTVTGGRGFSHVYFDPCREIGGEAQIVDYTPRRGVHWTSEASYAGRSRVRIELDARTSSSIWRCVRARLASGRVHRYGAAPMVENCVALVVGCLPPEMHERLREHVVGPCVSPNTVAAFFGIEGAS